jgi:polyhydroxyalkanoate synthesis regulator protein
VVPQFLAASFEMLREGQSKLMENLTAFPSPMSKMPGFEALQRQQQAFMKTMMGGWTGQDGAEDAGESATAKPAGRDDLETIKKQLAELQAKLAKL